jgi:hypothetical protein
MAGYGCPRKEDIGLLAVHCETGVLLCHTKEAILGAIEAE